MPTTLSQLDITNQVLRRLGDDPVTAITEATKRAQLVSAFWATTRDATLAAHPWNFATQRSVLYAYTDPAATLTPGAGATVVDTTGVTFTASAAVFVASDVGRTIQPDNAASGVALITGFTSATVVTATITTAWASLTAIAANAWRKYNAAPAWGRSYTILKPTDCLRVFRVGDVRAYEVETDGTQEVILTDEESLNVRLVMQVTDMTRWTALFTQALVAHLAAVITEPVTGQLAKGGEMWKLYQALLRQARTLDGMEGTSEALTSTDLTDVRLGG